MKDMMKNNQLGFPKVLYTYQDKSNYYIVMDQLGQSLKELRDAAVEQRFSLKSIVMISLQLLNRLQSIHKSNYIHRDLKPANIMCGRNKHDQGLIYLIDFGLAKKQNQISNIQHDGGNKVVGTAIYAAINAHLPGSNYYTKDDLESMMYVLCFLYNGTLPWKSCKANDSGLDKMLKLKIKISPYELFKDMPPEFAQIMEHIKTTPTEGQCDYRYIESMFKSVASNLKIKIDNQFDWILAKKKEQSSQKEVDKMFSLPKATIQNVENLSPLEEQKHGRGQSKRVAKSKTSQVDAHVNTLLLQKEPVFEKLSEKDNHEEDSDGSRECERGGRQSSAMIPMQKYEEEKVANVERRDSNKIQINFTVNIQPDGQPKNPFEVGGVDPSSIHVHVHISNPPSDRQRPSSLAANSFKLEGIQIMNSRQIKDPAEIDSESFTSFQKFMNDIQADENFQDQPNIESIKHGTRQLRIHSNMKKMQSVNKQVSQ